MKNLFQALELLFSFLVSFSIARDPRIRQLDVDELSQLDSETEIDPFLLNYINSYPKREDLIYQYYMAFEKEMKTVKIPKASSPSKPKVDPNYLPLEFTWQNFRDRNFLSFSSNYKGNEACDSVYLAEVAGIAADRIKIMKNGSFPEEAFSFQKLLSCGRFEKQMNGCRGGKLVSGMNAFYEEGLLPESCGAYRSRDWRNGAECKEQMECGTCGVNGCIEIPVESEDKRFIDSFALVQGELEMMIEIYAHGPISCSIAATTEAFKNYRRGEIMKERSALNITDHFVSVVGWGVDPETNIRYWITRNSWGEHWGDYGYAKIVRGENNLGIESKCTSIFFKETAKDSLSSEEFNQKTGGTMEKRQWVAPEYTHLSFKDQHFSGFYFREDLVQELLSKSHKNTSKNPRGAHFFWGKIEQFGSAENYMDPVYNQNNPKYCNAGWVFSVASMLSIRSSVSRKNAWPKVSVSVQALLNCKNDSGGSCKGGNPLILLEYISQKTTGAPLSTCMNYEAEDSGDCSPFEICRQCDSKSCWAVSDFPRISFETHSAITGVNALKEEIATSGPVVCPLKAEESFQSYSGQGVWEGSVGSLRNGDPIPINHYVLLSGWGEANGREYWIAKNSFGVKWGTEGYIQIALDYYSEGSNLACYAAQNVRLVD